MPALDLQGCTCSSTGLPSSPSQSRWEEYGLAVGTYKTWLSLELPHSSAWWFCTTWPSILHWFQGSFEDWPPLGNWGDWGSFPTSSQILPRCICALLGSKWDQFACLWESHNRSSKYLCLSWSTFPSKSVGSPKLICHTLLLAWGILPFSALGVETQNLPNLSQSLPKFGPCPSPSYLRKNVPLELIR